MPSWIAGLVVTGELTCDGCGKVMRHPDRYGYICEEDSPPRRLCEDCSFKEGYLREKYDDKGHASRTFL